MRWHKPAAARGTRRKEQRVHSTMKPSSDRCIQVLSAIDHSVCTLSAVSALQKPVTKACTASITWPASSIRASAEHVLWLFMLFCATVVTGLKEICCFCEDLLKCTRTVPSPNLCEARNSSQWICHLPTHPGSLSVYQRKKSGLGRTRGGTGGRSERLLRADARPLLDPPTQ